MPKISIKLTSKEKDILIKKAEKANLNVHEYAHDKLMKKTQMNANDLKRFKALEEELQRLKCTLETAIKEKSVYDGCLDEGV